LCMDKRVVGAVFVIFLWSWRTICTVLQPMGRYPKEAGKPGLSTRNIMKGIVQPFELKGVTRLIRSVVKNWRSGFLMILSHERSIKPLKAA
jgi:hypothetical protein